MSLFTILLLIAAGTVAGWVNTVAGGGSMVSVPALMWYGLSADVANGTSRIAILAQGFAAVSAFRREKRLDTSLLTTVAVPSVVGAVLGAYVATLVPEHVFRPILIATLVLMAASMFLKPTAFSPPPDAVPFSEGTKFRARLALFAVGFYGGFLQAGVGIMLLVVLAGLCRIDLVRGNALKVAVVFVYTIVVVLVFAARSKVDWTSGAVLAVGNVLGAELGVRFAVKASQTTVRNALFVVVLLCIGSVLLK